MSDPGQTVLFIGDDSESSEEVREAAWRRGLALRTGEECEEVPPERVALVALEVGAKEGGCVEALERALDRFPTTPVVAVAVGSDDLDTDTVVALMRGGATDVVSRRAHNGDFAERCLSAASPRPSSRHFESLVGEGPAMRRVRQKILDVARTSSTVLITGETGTGKGHIARACHQLSKRAGQPFVHVDCAALSPTIIESELFGHEKGSFTGAVARRTGRFELAHRGTIFLDEIGELETELQSKLLRVLQDREFERIGGTKTHRMDARVIAATSRDLSAAIDGGGFRADLYYRLNVFRIEMPALREHPEDIGTLAQQAIQTVAPRLEVAQPKMDDTFVRRLMDHPWHGNVRELINVMERVLVECRKGVLEDKDLDDVLGTPRASSEEPGETDASAPSEPSEGSCRSLAERMARHRPAVRDEIAEVLAETGGNIARTARRLRVPRSTLRYWIERYDLSNAIPRD